ncbi:MAG: NUDIX hydrolase [Armatimonadetes bacterium]|nr:NUDIX hydrolase [Armatimonadota bacterium]
MNKRQCFPRPAVSAVIVRDCSILLVKRGFEPNEGAWSFPGGRIEPGETAREAIEREVMEETSLRIEVGDVAGVYDVISRDGDLLLFHYVIINFRARVISGELKPASDAADARWFKFDELASLPTTPNLLDRLRAAVPSFPSRPQTDKI